MRHEDPQWCLQRRYPHVRYWPDALVKATYDDPWQYAIGLKDGSVVEFEGAWPYAGGRWVRLSNPTPTAGPLLGAVPCWERGIDIEFSQIVWAVDAPHGS